jgi:hypothetical protein
MNGLTEYTARRIADVFRKHGITARHHHNGACWRVTYTYGNCWGSIAQYRDANWTLRSARIWQALA